jgi:surface polysaccharide O-acyltransferase-like enzyme
MTTRPRALEVDLLRFVAICAMCTLHVVGTWQMMSKVGLWTKLFAVLLHDFCQMCVPVLFLLSMYLMARGFPSEGVSSVARWVGTRLKELLPPALAWAALYWAVGGWLQERELWATWFLRFYVGPLDWVTPLVSSHLWYMFALLQMVVLFPAVYGFVRRVSAGRAARAQVLLGVAFVLKGVFCWYVFRPGEQSAWLAWAGLMGPYWLDTMLFAIVWLIPGALRSEEGGREWLVVLALTLVINVGEVHRLAASGLPGLVAHSNWRFGNTLYGVAVFAAFLSHREALARRVSERVAGFLQRFNREYSFAFYLAHILLLTLAGNLQIHVLKLPPAASLPFLFVTTVAGTLGLLAVLKRVPFLRFLLGLRSAARSAGSTAVTELSHPG